jgi:SAM-dependent methyltransferase
MIVEFKPDWYEKFVQATDEKNLILDHAKKVIQENEYSSVLEIGLGTEAFFANELAPAVETYTIIERDTVEINAPDNVDSIFENWETVALDRTYDLIIASHVFYYFADKKAAVEKMFNSLNPGGKVLFVVNGTDPDYGPLKLAFAKMIGETYAFTYDELVSMLDDYSTEEFAESSTISADTYEDLFESLRIVFDNYPEQYTDSKEELIEYFKNQFGKPEFTVVQKILLASA